ncbi:peptide chain release factor 1 [Candidatus Woesearchaeota archaeon]|nr:peptide chain release factor 1 [Candidatus Woesearchaeota archaeon]
MASAQQLYKLKKFIKDITSHRALHTEFVTVYVPKGYDMNKIIQHLSQEQGTATNIKSAVTRKNVIDALERMIVHLRLYKQTPPNGLAAFSGNVAAREGKVDVKVWSIEPPNPLNTRLYRCDKDFKVDILQEMLTTKETYGLVVVDARDANIALLKGKAIIPLAKSHSHIPGKMKAGGQSSVRFASNRELAIKQHYKKVADLMKDKFLPLGNDLKGIIMGGPGPAKYALVDSGFLTGDVQKKIIGIKDLSYTDDFGLRELVEKSQDLLKEAAITDEKQSVQQFLELLAKEPGKVRYGEKDCRAAVELGAVQTLLVSEAVPDETVEELEELCSQYNTELKMISTETTEGNQIKELGLVAAVLRYDMGE